MKNLFLFIFMLLSINSFTQDKLDIKIDKGIQLYENGKKEKAFKIWKKVEKKSNKPSSTYGTALGNILWYYIENNDEENFLNYYKKIINSSLKEKDRNYEIGQPYKNYRYHATIHIASYYSNNYQFKKGLAFIEKADSLQFETTSLTSFIYQKVDLSFWKYRLLKDLNQEKKAIYELIKRAFEYNYKGMYPNWATVSPSNDELELSETICSKYHNLNKLKLQIDQGISNLKYISDKKKISFKINESTYLINPFNDQINTVEKSKKYLKNSFFYQYVTSKTNNK